MEIVELFYLLFCINGLGSMKSELERINGFRKYSGSGRQASDWMAAL